MSDNQRDNIHYMIMGIAIGISVGYMISMYVMYL